MSSNILFITGSDTGVGKTLVTSLVLAHLTHAGHRVGIVKPVETGCVRDGEQLRAADGDLLWEISAREQSLDEVVLHRFEPPVAPIVAAEQAGQPIEFEQLCLRTQEIASQFSLLLIEGAGGLLVPITEQHSFADLAARLDARVLIVIGSQLGAINHSALTFEVAKKRKLSLAGYVLNELHPPSDAEQRYAPEALDTNRELLAKVARSYGVEELASVPYLDAARDIESLKNHAQSNVVRGLSEQILEQFNINGA